MVNIGVFDSGLGGLWVLKHLEGMLPGYQCIYFADQANAPYGTKKEVEIIELSKKVVDFLLTKDCKLIVVACNTATSAAIEKLREEYNVPFVGMEPAVKLAVEFSKTKHIGVLATKATAEGKKLHDTIEKFAPHVDVHIVAGNGLVELVEDGKADTDEAEALLRKYLEPLLQENIDQLVLGCTHYAFLINRIKKVVGEKVNIIDPAPAVVARVKKLLKENSLLPINNSLPPQLFTSGEHLEEVKAFYKNLELPK